MDHGVPSNPTSVPAGWRHLLAAGMMTLFGRPSFAVAYDDAVEDLFELTPSRLLQLADRMYDISDYYSQPAGCPSGVVRLDTLTPTPRLAQACLFVASCDDSGYKREPALRELAAYPGRLALAAALIGCNDWVGPVQRAAEQLLDRLLQHDDAMLFEALELTLRLRARMCFRKGVWTRRIEPSLRAPRHALARWQATAHPSPLVREWAYAAVRECDPERAEQAVVAALLDPHPHIALPALRAIDTDLAPAQRDAALARTNTFAHFAVRIEALRKVQQFAIADAHSVLWTALTDRSPSVRGMARYLLDSGYGEGENAIAFWRELASDPDGRHARKALMSLSSWGRSEDVELFVRWFGHPHPKARSHALQGLILAKAPQLAGLIAQALGSAAYVLFEPALKAARHGRAPVSAAALQEAWTLQTSPELRARLVQAAPTLDKWEELEFLLRTLAQPQAEGVQAALVQGLRNWASGAAYRFGRLDPAKLPSLRASLLALETELPTEVFKQLRQQLFAVVADDSASP
ncbi:hypothetical protein [Pseudomonas sp. CGJS7]|uniref:hypothetical protein n=1 Tax=Pseudomonas sp. CGJS7 TaxID=3109348 RepID=UPI00300967A5